VLSGFFGFMGWRGVDERLIRRGELLLDLDFLEGYEEELESMNGGKEGRPFTFTRSRIGFLGVVRYLFSLSYRQLEGFAIALNRLVPKLPSGDYSGLRRRILELDLPFQGELRDSQEPVCIAVDSTGVRSTRRVDGGSGSTAIRGGGTSSST
jgi:hypothetical protein